MKYVAETEEEKYWDRVAGEWEKEVHNLSQRLNQARDNVRNAEKKANLYPRCHLCGRRDCSH